MGALFVYAGIYKLLYPGQAASSLEAVGLSRQFANFMVTGAVVLELYLGIVLLLKLDLNWSLRIAMGFMFAATAYLWYLSTLADPPSCGCLGLTGLFESRKNEAVFGVFRNCVILWALKLSYDYYFKPPGAVVERENGGAIADAEAG